jgi:serine/threonine protein kinase
MALQYLSRQGVVHRDGGLANWLISDVETEPKVCLIDLGLALMPANPLSEADSARSLLSTLCESETHLPNEASASFVDEEELDSLDMHRLNPLDWCYSPGAAGPNFPPPPELRVLRDELPSSAGDVLKDGGSRLPYSSGYDVWVLGWTFVQIVLGERWQDYKSGLSDDPLVKHTRKSFFEKHFQVPVPWELDYPAAWRLEILASGPEAFEEGFLDEFLRCASDRILADGEAATPLQVAFVKPDSQLRAIILRMIDFDAARRDTYLLSGALLRDLAELGSEDLLSSCQAASEDSTELASEDSSELAMDSEPSCT